MALNTELEGRVYTSGAAFEVTRVKIAELAAVCGFTDPIYYEREAARAAGYRDVVAPPTFLITPAQALERAYIDDPEAGVDYSKLLHTGQEFEYHEPVCAGDSITAVSAVESFKVRPKVSFVSIRTELTNHEGTLVAVARATLGQL